MGVSVLPGSCRSEWLLPVSRHGGSGEGQAGASTGVRRRERPEAEVTDHVGISCIQNSKEFLDLTTFSPRRS